MSIVFKPYNNPNPLTDNPCPCDTLWRGDVQIGFVNWFDDGAEIVSLLRPDDDYELWPNLRPGESYPDFQDRVKAEAVVFCDVPRRSRRRHDPSA